MKGCLKRVRNILLVVVLGTCGIVLLLALLGDGLGEDAMPTLAVLPDSGVVVVIPSITPGTSALLPTDTATVTPTATHTATITNTPAPTDTATITHTPPPTETRAPNDSQDAIEIEVAIRAVTDINVASVQVADGRPNGGERVVIIAYNSSASTESDLAGEWGSILGAVGSFARNQGIDLDAISIVVGDASGQMVGIVAAQVVDVLAFLDGRISNEEFFNRLLIEDF